MENTIYYIYTFCAGVNHPARKVSYVKTRDDGDQNFFRGIKMIEFFMPMIPPTVTAQEHQVMVRNGKPIFYDTPKIKNAKQKLRAALAPHAPAQPFTSAVRLTVKWLFPRGKHPDGEYRATKPDTDNLQKMLRDCMTECKYWTDDALVASEITEKFWAEIPGIYIRIGVL